MRQDIINKLKQESALLNFPISSGFYPDDASKVGTGIWVSDVYPIDRNPIAQGYDEESAIYNRTDGLEISFKTSSTDVHLQTLLNILERLVEDDVIFDGYQERLYGSTLLRLPGDGLHYIFTYSLTGLYT